MKNKIIRFNTGRKDWLTIKNATEQSADVYLYDEIGFWGTEAEVFVKQLAALDVEEINLHIDSPGGSVFQGNAIYTALKNHPARVNVFIDGLAASIASVIAMAGDSIEIAHGAMMMIHKPTVLMWGNADELRKEADVLDMMQKSIVETYVARTGKEFDEIDAWCDETKWFNADEAVEYGFADTKGEAKTAAASLTDWDLSLFDNSPDEPENSEDSNKITPLSLLIRKQALIEQTIK